jgi:integrase
MVLAEATGRRIGAIRRLRWSDCSFDPPSIRWRAEFDKRRREQVVPIPQTLVTEIKTFRVRLAAVGNAWIFKQAHKTHRGRQHNVRNFYDARRPRSKSWMATEATMLKVMESQLKLVGQSAGI